MFSQILFSIFETFFCFIHSNCNIIQSLSVINIDNTIDIIRRYLIEYIYCFNYLLIHNLKRI